MNSNGIMLLEFCTRFQLSIKGTILQLKNRLKSTWQHLRSKHWHQLDHVVANKEAKQHITVTKVNLTADCFTDHKLLVCKCRFSIKPKKKGAKPPKKLNTNVTSERKEKLERFLNERLPECSSRRRLITHLEGKKWFQTTGLTIRTRKSKSCSKTRS